MACDDRNYYRIYRELAGLTQESAAARMGYSVEHFGRIERSMKVPDEMVRQMAHEYREPYLAIWHLKYTEHG